MEIHHHPHVERKRFKEYFLEFLMLFLAVTLGFFAENIREHYSEKRRAKDFALSMTEDLEKDTATLNYALNYFRDHIAAVDTLNTLVERYPFQKIPAAWLVYYSRSAMSGYRVSFNDATMQELKNSGSLRFFSNGLRKQISAYDNMVRQFSTRQDNETGLSLATANYFEKLFLAHWIEVDDTSGRESFLSNSEVKLANNDPVLFSQFLVNLTDRKNNWENRIQTNIIPLRQAADKLILALKSEYDFK